ncbi:MAG: XdhC/CoxI family protein [bacterium]
MKAIFQRIQELCDEERHAALVTVVESSGSTPRKPGARMIVYPDGSIEGTIGGGGVEKHVIEEALTSIETGESQLIHIDLRENKPDSIDAVCGGELRVFIETIGSVSRLLIFGAGHVGRALAHMAKEMDLRVVVYDDRKEQAQVNHFPSEAKVICGSFEEAIKTLQPTPHDYIAIMTYNHALDESLLKNALKTPAVYVGMVGSRTKCKRIKDNLAKQGVSAERLNEVHAPIGLAIGAHTPAEIAVSILAEIVKEANR